MQSFTVPVASQPLAITTSRLILRQWQDKDFEPFAAMNADPQVMEFFPSVLAREKSDEMAIRCRDLITERGWGIWVVELRETGEFMGFVGLHTPGYNLPFNPCVEVGWRLRADAWGQGFCTEAARAALDAGFIQLGLNEIVAFTALPNVRSQAVMKKLGMVCDPEENFMHPVIEEGHWLREHCLYRLKRV
ncbi:GNAT family N-acetyltransferase [Rahnella aceris]|uniref:GNAT family N-acetyltransferase n=1 Tax=Rahnella sp. (strain Y9602) TaxID=2703885 RepID=UPI000EAFE303|nr:GNAT family N-acetyltransferase [Rahnella aceris]MBU9866032.1 GNAT family N-acetyltransferase [Rahnella aceris]RKT80211.1 RimJ/RimL family protein N-acetyltransferase [Rahnella aquatilis]UNK54001.1 GNAT family N-acetyltransferase [Rahnella aceris]